MRMNYYRKVLKSGLCVGIAAARRRTHIGIFFRSIKFQLNTSAYGRAIRQYMKNPQETCTVLAIDQGTSSTRVILYDLQHGLPQLSHQIPITHYKPQPGWLEIDPIEIMRSVETCLSEVMQLRRERDYPPVCALGITNQRETTIVWDSVSGKPLYNAIVWADTRTSGLVTELTQRLGGRRHLWQQRTGLPLATYFSALKLKWLLDNVPAVRDAVEKRRALFGTVDSWLIWNLTGGPSCGIHVTDVTNASRTLLWNLHTRQWDTDICESLGIPLHLLPTVKSSAEIYGIVTLGAAKDIPISGCLGDQQAALVGQKCLRSGQAKNTYGTGCFMLYNTGPRIVHSTHGLLSTVAYQLGAASEVIYALEGSIAVAGASVDWLKDNLGIIAKPSEIDVLAQSVPDNGGVYFVPAFSGLYAPYWRPDARGIIAGLTSYSTKAHLARACLEAVCFQTAEIVEAMQKESGTTLQKLRVDGGMCKSDLLLQIQADLLNIVVERPKDVETTSRGAAWAAIHGLRLSRPSSLPTTLTAPSGDEWWSLDSSDGVACATSHSTQFFPKLSAVEREKRFAFWKKAVQRSFNWTDEPQ
jgi:glycerol kinase